MWMRIAHATVFVPNAIDAQAPVVDRPDDRVGRYTRFGWRLGAAEGPWRTGDGAQCADGRELVRNPVEQAIMRRILSECDGTGSRAHRLAKAFAAEGVLHPRTGKPWRAGSIMMLYGTRRRRAEASLMDIISAATANQVQA